MDRLAAMKMLLAVAEEGSFTSAARKMGVPLPTLSRRVGELESLLDSKLLNRSTRLLTLTDAGRSYVDACKTILAQIKAAESAVTVEHTTPKGDLTITAPTIFGRHHVLPVVLAFLVEYPEINIELVLTDQSSRLAEDGVDIAVRIGELPDTSLVATRIGASPLVVCASPSYFVSRGMPEKPEDICEHDCITCNNFPATEKWKFARTAPVDVKARLTVDSAEAAVEAAISGFGLTRVLRHHIEGALRAGMLEIALEDFQSDPWPINLIYMPRHSIPAKVRSFLDWSIPRLKARLRNIDRESGRQIEETQMRIGACCFAAAHTS